DSRLLELTEQVSTQLGVAVRRFFEADTVTLTDTVDDSGLSARAAGRLGEVAHQVRTPLNGIIGNLELLCESGLDEEQRDLSALALQSAIDLHQRIEAWLERVDQLD